MPEAPVFKDTLRTFAAALSVHPRTVANMVERGDVRVVRFGGPKRPLLRLEPPEEYLARLGRYSGPEPISKD